MITHEHEPGRPLSQSAIMSHFSKTSIQDCSIESLKGREIRVLHFHTDSRKHDWQCFVDMNRSKYMSEFGNSENSVCRQASMLDINTDTSRYSKKSWLALLNSLRVARLCMRGVCFNLALFTTLRRLLVPTTFKMSSEKCIALDGWSN